MFTSSFVTFGIVFLAEIGDKSQLVCMALASRYKALPVFIGAVCSFLVLNLLAVTLGSTISEFLPMPVLIGLSSLLFAVFGIHALFFNDDDSEEDEQITIKSGKSVLITTFAMIFLAELGDKTQLAVAALSTNESPVGVWIGASLALAFTTVLGVYAGRKLLNKLHPLWLNRLSGLFFLLLALLGAIKVAYY